MDGIIFDDCPRRGNGDPKRSDQMKRRQENRCVYCGMPKRADGELLGLACDACQQKRWAELKLTEQQHRVIQGIANGKQDKEIADEMEISIDGVKRHIRPIAHKLAVRYNRVLLTRCYMEGQKYLTRIDCTIGHGLGSAPAAPHPVIDTPLKGTPRNGTPRKGSQPKHTARIG
jgi:DNA-binding CsgD family transcriptional regulator